MLNITRMKTLYESPLPPMCLTDYDAMSKFLNYGAQRCKASGRNFDLFLDWVIQALLASLTSDSAARIFLPKTKTAPFELDALLPISTLPCGGKKRVFLREARLIAPLWNNTELGLALEAFYDSNFQDIKIDEPFGGAYIEELKLAIIDSPSNVDLPHVLRTWHRGSILLNAYSLKDLEEYLSTDGDNWYIQKDERERQEAVQEPRMAALYNCALRRYCAGK